MFRKVKKNIHTKIYYNIVLFIIVFSLMTVQFVFCISVNAYNFKDNLIEPNSTFMKKRGELILDDCSFYYEDTLNFGNYNLFHVYDEGQKNNNYLLYDIYGKQIGNAEFETYYFFEPQCNFIVLEKDKKKTIFNYKSGKFLNEYTEIDSKFYNGLLKVRNSEKSTYVDYDGKEIIPMQSSDEFSKYTRVGDGFLWYHSDYEEVDKIFDNNGKIIIEGKKFNSCKLIESNIVTTERDLNIDSFFNTYISIYNKKGTNIFKSDHYDEGVEETGYHRYKYDEIKMYGEKNFFVIHKEASGTSIEDYIEMNDCYIMNSSGTVVVNLNEFDYPLGVKDNYWILTNNQNKETTYYTLDSSLKKQVFPQLYLDIYSINGHLKNGYINDQDPNNNIRFFDKNGKSIENVQHTVDTTFKVNDDDTSWIYSDDEGKFNIIDTKNDKIIKDIIGEPVNYDHKIFYTRDSLENKYNIYSSDGKLLRTVDELYMCENGIHENTYVINDYSEENLYKVRIFDEKNNELLKDYILYDSSDIGGKHNFFKAEKNGNQYIANYKGDILFELDNQDVNNNITKISGNLFLMYGKNKTYIYNTNGNVIGTYQGILEKVKVINNFLYVSSTSYDSSKTINKVEIYELFNQDIDIIDRTPQLIDCYPSNLTVSNNGNISMSFDIPIEYILGKGNIYIKEYDTDKIILTYNVAESPNNEGIIYSDDTYTKIELENSLNRLPNNKYYITIENNCFYNKKNVEKWFNGIQNKDELSFTVLNQNESYDDVTFLAATSFVDSQDIKVTKVADFLNSKEFKNRNIWNGTSTSYKSFYKQTINNYNVIEYGDKSNPYVLLIDKTHKNGIIVFDNKNNYYDFFDVVAINSNTSMTKKAISERFNNVVAKVKQIKTKYNQYNLTLTGEKSAGVFAAYLSTVLDIPSVVFGSKINQGVAFALLDNPVAVNSFEGIDKIKCKNITTDWSKIENILQEHFNGINHTKLYNNLTNIKVKENGNGDGLGKYIEQNESGLFTLMSPIAQKKSDGKMVYYNDQSFAKIFDILGSDTFKQLDIVDAMTKVLDYNLVFVGSSGIDEKTFLDIVEDKIPHIYYNGNSSSENYRDVFNGGMENDVFVSTSGFSKFDGGAGKDTYIINKNSKVVEINDISSISISDDLQLLKSVAELNLSNIYESVKNSKSDTIVFKDAIIKESDVKINRGYYEITSEDTRVKINMQRFPASKSIYIVSKDGSKFKLDATKARKTAYSTKNDVLYYLNIDTEAKIDFYNKNDELVYSVDTTKLDTNYSNYGYFYTGNNKLNAYISNDISTIKINGKTNRISYYHMGDDLKKYEVNEDLTGNTFILDLEKNQCKNELEKPISVIQEQYTDGFLPNDILINSDTPYSLKQFTDYFENLEIGFKVEDDSIVQLDNGCLNPLNEGKTNLDVLISGEKVFTIKIEVNYTNKIDIKKLNVSVENVTYTGENVNPKVEICNGDYILKENFDYVIKYENNKNVGNGKIIIYGKNRYTSTKEIIFNINPCDLNNTKIQYKNTYSYTGNKIKPEVVIEYNGILLKENEDYNIIYQNNIEIGTGQIVINGINNFTGKKICSFNISPNKDVNQDNNSQNETTLQDNKKIVNTNDNINILKWILLLVLSGICFIILKIKSFLKIFHNT